MFSEPDGGRAVGVAPGTIDDVVQRLETIAPEAVELGPRTAPASGSADGVASFNALYLEVTRHVRDKCLEAGFFRQPEWIAHLDVVFAGYYFDAIDAAAREEKIPREWRPLFKRREAELHPLQFAFTGMNAHINHDLPFAIIRTCQELGIDPCDGDAEREDFTKVNAILADVEDGVKARYADGVIGNLDRALGRVDDVLVMWNVAHARDTAWGWAELLWPLRDNEDMFRRADDLIGGLVGFAGRGLTLLRVG